MALRFNSRTGDSACKDFDPAAGEVAAGSFQCVKDDPIDQLNPLPVHFAFRVE
jgi:hypothetical protein